MVCFCPERKILYIHLPKCAGLTVESILITKYNFKHFTFTGTEDPYPFLREARGKLGIYRYILNYSNEAKTIDFSKYKKFTVVRNPYTRGESGIRYLHKNSAKQAITRDVNGKAYIKSGHFPMGIDRFYRTCLNRDYYYMHFCLSQKRSLEDLQGNIDFTICRFENLMIDLKKVLFDDYELEPFDIDKIHVNQSKKERLTMNILHVREKIREIHEEDFRILGYDIDEEYVEESEIPIIHNDEINVEELDKNLIDLNIETADL